MSDDASHFRARAAAERANAGASALDNVKDRSVRAARAWDAMAERADRVSAQRREREIEAAGRRMVPLDATE